MVNATKKTRQPIADKVLKKLDRDAKAKVIDLSAVRASRKQIADLDATHVNFNTPYVMHANTQKAHWLASIERVLASAKGHNPEQDFYNYMKFGPEPFYWTEYVFEAYSNHTADMILLHGLPDQPETRPHSDLFQSGSDLLI